MRSTFPISVLPDSPPTLAPHFSSPLLLPPPPPDFEVPFMGESCEDVTYPLGFSRSFFKGVWAAAGGVNFYTMHSCLHSESFFLPFGHLSGTGGQNNGGRRPHSGHFSWLSQRQLNFRFPGPTGQWQGPHRCPHYILLSLFPSPFDSSDPNALHTLIVTFDSQEV